MFMFRVISTGLLLTLLRGASGKERNNAKEESLEEETIIWGREIRQLKYMSMTEAPIGKAHLSVR